ncbi:FAD-dependent oxidoreductase [Rhizobium sp. LjRoot30]|uniref:dihydrolipoyl dehydrogenase family protein n=1 Tax=Rhizobium sp. LjRoot30 TaxID=3342320 RepID=UPI003ECFFEF9
MAELLSPDICIIGGGPVGIELALSVVAFGASVVLVEAERWGEKGVGRDIALQAFSAAARHVATIGGASALGIATGPVSVDFAALRAHIADAMAAAAPNASAERLAARGIWVLRSQARFTDRRTIEAGNYLVRPRRFVITGGSVPIIPDIPGLSTLECLTMDTILDVKAVPDRLLVLGAGAEGLQIAQGFRRLGVQVTVIDEGRALSECDPEPSALVLHHLRSEGIVLIEDMTVTHVERAPSAIRVHGDGADGPAVFDCSHLLVASGRRADVAGLDLAAAGIKADERGIVVGPGLRSRNRRVYAIGEATGRETSLAAARQHMAAILPQLLFRLARRAEPHRVPRIVWTDPEIAEIGLGVEEARKRYGAIRLLRWPYAENDRARAERRTAGLVRILVSTREKVLGVTIVGENAAELIDFWSLVIARGLALNDIRSHVPPCPTFSEIGKSAAVSYDRPLMQKPWTRFLIRFLARLG